MSNLKEAIALATRAHQGQTDKAGAPYILHPLRIMQRMDSEEAKMVAVLHDVVEDTLVTLEELRALNFSETVVAAVDSLTRRAEESYETFIERVKLNPLARKVKLADLEDNMDLQRLQHVTDRDKQRWQRYAKASAALSL
jgi:(p)ppGpp synthase/HD superfamily hydrolase